jgi:hypothetical protein
MRHILPVIFFLLCTLHTPLLAQDRWFVLELALNPDKMALNQNQLADYERLQKHFRDSLSTSGILKFYGALPLGGEFWVVATLHHDAAVNLALSVPMVKAAQLNPNLSAIRELDGRLCISEKPREIKEYILLKYRLNDYGIKMTDANDDGSAFLERLLNTDKLLLSIKGFDFEGIAILDEFDIANFAENDPQVKELKLVIEYMPVFFPKGVFCED